MDTVTIDGKQYQLVPVDKKDEKEKKDDIFSAYQGSVSREEVVDKPVQETDHRPPGKDKEDVEVSKSKGRVVDAEPKPSKHRKAYLQRNLNPADFGKGKGIPIDIVNQYADIRDLSKKYKGDELFFGKGIELG